MKARLFWVVFGAMGLVLVVAVFFFLPMKMVTSADVPDSFMRLRAQNDVRGVGVQVLGGIILIAGLFLTRRTVLISREAETAKRLGQALDQLASPQREQRVSALSTMGILARGSLEQRQQLVRLITAWLREHATGITDKEIRPEVQEAMTVLRTSRFADREVPLDLSRLDLRDCSLRKANLQKCSLMRSHLERATLEWADLRDSNLYGAHLRRARLMGADLTGCKLERADLRGADLRRAVLKREQLRGARVDAGTKLPWAPPRLRQPSPALGARRGFFTHRLPFTVVDHESGERYGPGQQPSSARPARPGDFILTHGSGFICLIIRVGQGLWIHGEDRQYTYWNHAALVVDDHGGLVEALSGGVKSTNLARYLGSDYHLVRIKASDEDRREVVGFGASCVGAEYGYLTILSIALTILVRSKATFFIQGDQICSGLVARAQERTSAIFNRNPVSIMPADLAKFYSVGR